MGLKIIKLILKVICQITSLAIVGLIYCYWFENSSYTEMEIFKKFTIETIILVICVFIWVKLEIDEQNENRS